MERSITISNYHAMKKIARYFDYEISESELEHFSFIINENEDNVACYLDGMGDEFIFNHADTLDEAITELLLFHE